MIRWTTMLLWLLGAALAARAAEPAFVPLASGSLGAVTATDGDSAFDAAYFRDDALAGTPIVSRLESAVGAGPSGRALEGGYTARWSGTVTPNQSGVFSIALRADGAATVTVDGRVLLRSDAPSTAERRIVAPLQMRRARPYHFVVEFHRPGRPGRIALEWAQPRVTVDASSAATSLGRETAIGPSDGAKIGTTTRLENTSYVVETLPAGAWEVTQKATGAKARFTPEFAVVSQPPGRESKFEGKGGKFQNDGPVGQTNYQVPVWDKETDFLAAAQPRVRLRAERMSTNPAGITWQFPARPEYALSAELALPADGGEPRLTWHFQPNRAGQYSIGYVGAPTAPLADPTWIWQPLVWQDQRYPNRSYLTLEYQCPIPFTLVGRDGNVVGVGADPREMPYRMPTYDDSRFGVLVRNATGEAQSQLYAPVLGGPESKMAAGRAYTFSVRLFVGRGTWFESYRQLATRLYQFHDYRENTLCSLNTTIENLTDYVLNDRFCYWYPRYKTWGYQNDGGAGAGRQQSAADAVSLARVFDRAELLERRGRPTLEYMLSRNGLMTNFSQPDFMGGHVKNASDLTAAYHLTGSRTTVIRDLFAGDASGTDTGKRRPLPKGSASYAARMELAAALTTYSLTGERAALDEARAAGDRYIAERIGRPAVDFKDLGSSFWTEMAPAYDLLYELYEATGDPRHLDGAAAAMRQFTAYEYLVPVIPAGTFVANPGGRYNNQPAPEEIVPAWQVSANGLAPECAATAHSHRGVFMASYAAWMLRLARDTSEPFFRDIGRSAVVGRYANYPSYAYRNGYTTVHQKPDYPLRPFEEIKKFTSAHYNHPLPMTAFLVDYLVSDVYARSDAKVTFPSDYSNTGAYFRNKVYGARPGRFYDEAGVYLWLPKRLLTADSVQVNYLAARGNGRLYLAFTNQSPRAITTAIAIDPARVALSGSHRAHVWVDNKPAGEINVVDGRATVPVSPKGLTCLAIDGAGAKTEIQDAMLAADVPALPHGSSRTVPAGFGDVTATALRFGRGLTSVHVWLKSGPDQVRHAALQYSIGGQTRRLQCAEFPYEFTVAVPDDAPEFSGTVEARTPNGSMHTAKVGVRLQEGG